MLGNPVCPCFFKVFPLCQTFSNLLPGREGFGFRILEAKLRGEGWSHGGVLFPHSALYAYGSFIPVFCKRPISSAEPGIPQSRKAVLYPLLRIILQASSRVGENQLPGIVGGGGVPGI